MTTSRCPNCRGTGTVVKTYDDYGIADPKDVTCPVCLGRKRVQPASLPSSVEAGTAEEVK